MTLRSNILWAIFVLVLLSVSGSAVLASRLMGVMGYQGYTSAPETTQEVLVIKARAISLETPSTAELQPVGGFAQLNMYDSPSLGQEVSSQENRIVSKLKNLVPEITLPSLPDFSGLWDFIRIEKLPELPSLPEMPALPEFSFDLAGADVLDEIEPFAGSDKNPAAEEQGAEDTYDETNEQIEVEGVLVPQTVMVISSSRDGRIDFINFKNGDSFKKGDVLIAYECTDLDAELAIAQAEKKYTQRRLQGGEELFKLDILSSVEKTNIESEDQKATARLRLLKTRMEDCYIRAPFNGRVTNRLANAHEYTRTDRVLMEVASNEQLVVEFLVPSTWLKWINVGAPIYLTLNETGERYPAKIRRIHGEVDPVSQSVQITAQLAPYKEQLLPGMSGQVEIDAGLLRQAGITGFLHTHPKKMHH